MMTELSLNVLDVAENSTHAGASLVEISVTAAPEADLLTIIIKDNGCGMTAEQVAAVTDPFYTTRKTRKVGLGVPFFKYAAESTGGQLTIDSTPGVGTTVTATFGFSHIDRMPLGDMVSTMQTLITCHSEIDFIYRYRYGKKSFALDTREFREILGDVPLNTPEIASYIKDYLSENTRETDDGAVY